jgi:hypothetical protein
VLFVLCFVVFALLFFLSLDYLKLISINTDTGSGGGLLVTWISLKPHSAFTCIAGVIIHRQQLPIDLAYLDILAQTG